MGKNPIDIHIGERLRMRRNILGLSQEQVGKKIGVTFQQIQKYEQGKSQIGPSKLYELGNSMGVDISFFFEGFSLSGKNQEKGFAEDATKYNGDMLSSKEALNLVKSYYDIQNQDIRKKVLSLIKSISGDSKH